MSKFCKFVGGFLNLGALGGPHNLHNHRAPYGYAIESSHKIIAVRILKGTKIFTNVIFFFENLIFWGALRGPQNDSSQYTLIWPEEWVQKVLHIKLERKLSDSFPEI